MKRALSIYLCPTKQNCGMFAVVVDYTKQGRPSNAFDVQLQQELQFIPEFCVVYNCKTICAFKAITLRVRLSI